jgi:signal peptidase I
MALEVSMRSATAENNTPTSAQPPKPWLSWVKQLAACLIVMLTFRSAVADWNYVPTGSMKPTILEGDRIFVNKLAYDLKVPLVDRPLLVWCDPKRGDIVVFRSPTDGTLFVKRVVGVPGDRLELTGNRLLINGEPAVYEPLDASTRDQLSKPDQAEHLFAEETVAGRTHPVMTTPLEPGPEDFGPVTVPPGQYFVMGDNRDNSLDSRFFGFLERERILGRATAVVLSLDPGNHLLPRGQRFFRALP